MRKLVGLILLSCLLAGCQTQDGLLSGTSEDVSVTGPAASAIAGDMAGRFAEQMGTAGSVTIQMKSDGSEYALALQAALRGWGYTVVSDETSKGDVKPVELTWSLDNFEGQVLARLSTDTLSLGRAYLQSAGGAEPASPLSVMHSS